MQIKTLQLRNYRNYERAVIRFAPGMNILTGLNAQGKTNLLESLVYLSLTRSHRLNDDQQLIRSGCEAARISCAYEDGIERKIEAVIHKGGKTLLVNGQPVHRSSEFIGLLNVVLFAPDDLGLFTDAPRERRRLMNQEIAKISPAYLKAMSRYQNLLRERNIHLKRFEPNETYLDTLDEQMIAESVQIINARREFIQSLNEEMQRLYRELSDSEDQAGLEYLSVIGPEEDPEEGLRSRYRESRQKDVENHVTGIGVHREDLLFTLNGQNITLTGSQGQKRMSMLSFKMALLAYIQIKTGRQAVLLLDDVFSELDQNRQKKLVQMIRGTQCLITATEIPPLLRNSGAEEYTIISGTVSARQKGIQ